MGSRGRASAFSSSVPSIKYVKPTIKGGEMHLSDKTLFVAVIFSKGESL